MQSEGYIEAEASCYKKHQPSQNETTSATPPLCDNEKAGVNDVGTSITGHPAIEATSNADSALDDKGIFEPTNAPGSDNSSDTDEEKDDFPEGGLRA